MKLSLENLWADNNNLNLSSSSLQSPQRRLLSSANHHQSTSNLKDATISSSFSSSLPLLSLSSSSDKRESPSLCSSALSLRLKSRRRPLHCLVNRPPSSTIPIATQEYRSKNSAHVSCVRSKHIGCLLNQDIRSINSAPPSCVRAKYFLFLNSNVHLIKENKFNIFSSDRCRTSLGHQNVCRNLSSHHSPINRDKQYYKPNLVSFYNNNRLIVNPGLNSSCSVPLCIIHTVINILDHKPSVLGPRPSILGPSPSCRNQFPSISNTYLSILGPRPSILGPHPSKISQGFPLPPYSKTSHVDVNSSISDEIFYSPVSCSSLDHRLVPSETVKVVDPITTLDSSYTKTEISSPTLNRVKRSREEGVFIFSTVRDLPLKKAKCVNTYFNLSMENVHRIDSQLQLGNITKLETMVSQPIRNKRSRDNDSLLLAFSTSREKKRKYYDKTQEVMSQTTSLPFEINLNENSSISKDLDNKECKLKVGIETTLEDGKDCSNDIEEASSNEDSRGICSAGGTRCSSYISSRLDFVCFRRDMKKPFEDDDDHDEEIDEDPEEEENRVEILEMVFRSPNANFCYEKDKHELSDDAENVDECYQENEDYEDAEESLDGSMDLNIPDPGFNGIHDKNGDIDSDEDTYEECQDICSPVDEDEDTKSREDEFNDAICNENHIGNEYLGGSNEVLDLEAVSTSQNRMEDGLA